MIPISLFVLVQIGICFNRFWSSDKLTGSQTIKVPNCNGYCFGAVTN